jgi:hypothetical protein
MIYILYSGDYEVFLGGNYCSEREVMVETTEKVFDIFHAIEVPLTFFADVCCLWRYREHGYEEFPNEVDDQLCRALRLGHDVQAHIHPHWPSTSIERNDQQKSHYKFVPEAFMLGTHSGDVYEFALDLMRRARKYLMDLLRPIDSQYECIAFRAGAYGIQPMPEVIFAALQEAGFLIDSSIVPGLKRKSKGSAIDFTCVPDEGNYYISSEYGLSVAKDKGIYEIPILATRLKGWRSHFRAILGSVRRHLRKPQDLIQRGYIAEGIFPRTSIPFHRRLRQLLFDAPFRQLELSDDVGEMLDITRQYIRKYQSRNENLYFALSFHPKDMFPSRLESLKKYQARLARLYGSSLKAITFQDAARNVSHERGRVN